MIPIPTVEITRFLIALSKNPKFLRIGRILMLIFVALSAIGCSGVWAKGLEAWMPGCTVPTWGCYSGPPLSMTEYIDQLAATRYLLLLPLLDLIFAMLILFQPPRTYLMLMPAGIFSFFLPMLGGYPHPYTNVDSGSGQTLHIIATLLLSLLSLSLAIAEQAGNLNKRKSWQEEWGLKN
jgi:hypothetical protein